MADLASSTRDAVLHSRQLMVRANLIKLFVLASAVPVATVGIAQRAHDLVGSADEANLVGVVAAFGSLAGIVGAVVFGWAADARGAAERARWAVVLVSSLVATAGALWLTAVVSSWQLVASWMLLQLGVAGASAVLRTLLSHALPAHRRRGATAMIVFTYIGVGLPLLVLLVLPMAVWSSAVVFGVLAVLAAAVAWMRGPGVASGASAGVDDEESPLASAESNRDRLPYPFLVIVQLAFHVVMAAYLSYHALDVAARFETATSGWDAATVRVSVLTLLAALAGLLVAAIAAMIRSVLLGRALPVVAGTGLLLSVTVSLRGVTDSVPMLLVLLLLSGAAVGLSSATLLTAALEGGRRSRAGRRVGVYSAATAIGQLIGPLFGLGLIRLFGDYHALYLVLGTVPLIWAGWALAIMLRRRVVTQAVSAG